MLKVFGHLNPDTDSTCAAIAYAWFLRQLDQEAEAFILGEVNREVLYVLSYFKVENPSLLTVVNGADDVVIVDTNNPSELLETIEQANIVEIIDHHKLAGLSTPDQVTVTLRPVACTCTIIWELMQAKNIQPTTQIAGLMLSAILSDTLKFSSPTTTQIDQKAATALTTIAGVDIDSLASEMFAAKSDLTGMDPRDILLSDSKVFTMGNKKIRISSLETTDPQAAFTIKADLLTAIGALKEEEHLDGLFFFIVDIFSSSSTLLLASEFELSVAAQAFEKQPESSMIELPGVVSRKKQMVPPLEQVLSA